MSSTRTHPPQLSSRQQTTRKCIGRMKVLLDMRETTQPVRYFVGANDTWYFHTYLLPHPTNPQLDKIQLQLTRNVMITQNDFIMSWCDKNGDSHEIRMDKTDIHVKYTIPRWNQREKKDNVALIEVYQDITEKDPRVGRLSMDEVKGVKMTREANWQLTKQRIKYFLKYDAMLAGTNGQGFTYLWHQEALDKVDRMGEMEDRLNVQLKTSMELKDLSVRFYPRVVGMNNLSKEKEKEEQPVKQPAKSKSTKLLTFPDELPPMKVLTPVQMKKEEQPVKSKALEKQEARNMELQQRKKKNKR